MVLQGMPGLLALTAHADGAPWLGVRGTHPLRTAVASATVAGMMKKELADTAS